MNEAGRGVSVDLFGGTTSSGKKCAGKLRHGRDGQSRVQEKAETGDLCYRKLKRTENTAALLTKALAGGEITKYIDKIDLEGKSGSAEMSLAAQVCGFTVLMISA